MSGRELLQNALDHKEGKVPIDFGSTPVTGIHCTVVEKLRKHYGLEERPVKICEPYQMLGMIEEDLKEAIGVDVDGIYPRNTMFGFPLTDWKEWRAPWGQLLLVPGKFVTTTDEKKDYYLYPEGDTSVSPSGRLPDGGYFFDAVIRQEHFDEENLNVEDNLQEFNPLSDEDLEHFRRSVEEVSKSGRGVIANVGGTGLGDIALVPAMNLKDPRGIRDVEEWYVSTVMRQDYLHEIFDRQTDIAVKNLERVKDILGDTVQSLFICGT
ncbi:MAG: methyltransferase, partial [Spirochaetaceae bacterium]